MSAPAKAPKICADLRQDIVSGRFAPGTQLPTRSELIARYGVSSVTIQSALSQLIGEGFVEAEGRRGTFVTECPPHLARFALLLPSKRPNSPVEGNHFFRVICAAAEGYAKQAGYSIEIVEGVHGWRRYEHYERLTEDVVESRLSGLIFAGHPFLLEGTPILEHPGMPRIAVMENKYYPLVDAIWPDYADMIRKALEYFESVGRHKIAVLTHCSFLGTEEILFCNKPESLTILPHWIQAVPLDKPRWASNLARLFFANGPQNGPDGLLIIDDNLVEPALDGLKASGVAVPDDVEVVAHANFPWLTGEALPVKRIGFDVDALFARCVEHILKCRRGQPVPESQTLEAKFANADIHVIAPA